MKRMMIMAVALIGVGGTLIGCEAKQGNNGPQLDQATPECAVNLVYDLSPSFEQMMRTDVGIADRFSKTVLDRYFKDQMASDSRLIISQISGNIDANIWDGKPQTLRLEFPTAEQFNNFLLQNANPNGSPCHRSVAAALEYMTDYPGVAQGRTKSAVIVMSDMEDTDADLAQKDRLLKAMAAYAKVGGVMGIYWVNDPVLWRRHGREAGFKNFVVEGKIVRDPILPSFE